MKGGVAVLTSQEQGSLLIQSATSTDTGYYQCVATNQWGTAPSNVSFVQMASLGAYPSNPTTANFPVVWGAPLMLPCNPPASTPNATYSWATAASTTSADSITLPTSSRVIVDAQGMSFFFLGVQLQNAYG